MSAPVIVANPSPIFLDKTVLDYQNRIAQASYIDAEANTALFFDSGLVFGIAERDVETNEPKLYTGSDKGRKEYYSLEPNDRVNSFVFFYESAPRQQQDKQNFVADLSLIVWYNQKAFDSVSYRIQEALINEVVQRLLVNNYNYQNGSMQVYTRQSDVFADFTLREETRGYLSAPYDGFRIRFRTRSLQDCSYQFNATSAGC